MSKQLTGQTEPRLPKFYTAFYFRKFYIPYNEHLDPSKGEIMNNTETTKTEEIGLGKELVTSFVRQTVASAAVWTGLGLVLVAASKITKVFGARKDKKTHTES